MNKSNIQIVPLVIQGDKFTFNIFNTPPTSNNISYTFDDDINEGTVVEVVDADGNKTELIRKVGYSVVVGHNSVVQLYVVEYHYNDDRQSGTLSQFSTSREHHLLHGSFIINPVVYLPSKRNETTEESIERSFVNIGLSTRGMPFFSLSGINDIVYDPSQYVISRISGQFILGKQVGTWVWSTKGVTVVLIGQYDEEGLAHGRWNFYTKDKVLLGGGLCELGYRRGIWEEPRTGGNPSISYVNYN